MEENRWFGLIGRLNTPTKDGRVLTALAADRLTEGPGILLFDRSNDVVGKVEEVDVSEAGMVVASGSALLSPGTYHIGIAVGTPTGSSEHLWQDDEGTTYMDAQLLGCQVGPYHEGLHAPWPGVQMVVYDL